MAAAAAWCALLSCGPLAVGVAFESSVSSPVGPVVRFLAVCTRERPVRQAATKAVLIWIL